MSSSGNQPLSSSMFRPEKPDDWEEYREIITTLYQDQTLAEVMAQMKTLHFFYATPKQYKTKLRDWGLTTKYVKDFEYEELLNQEEQDEYNVRGKRVSHQDVARFKRRKEKSESKSGDGKSSKGKSSSKSSSSKSHGGSSGGGAAAAGVGYYDDNRGEGSSGPYIMSSDQYIAYSTSGGGGGGYMTSDGITATSVAGYSGYTYDTSGGAGGEVYDPQLEEGGYEQQGGSASGYQQHQGYGSSGTAWGY